ncbi:MAG: general secretion pathway protein GspB [Geobacteraceae bacterium]
MSSILKALQKLEQEKANRPDREIDVARGIVVGRRPAPRPVWIVPAGMVGVALLAVLVTYTLMSGFVSLESSPEARPVTAPAAAGQPGSAAGPSSPPTTSIREENIPAETLPKIVKRAAAGTPIRPVGRSFSIAPSVDVTPPPSLTTSPAASSEPVDPARNGSPQERTVGTRHPAIKVSGIAWQKDSTARLAVVNGVSVTEGSTVEGARVEGISPDRVRFSYKNEKFDVSLGKETP